MTLHDAAVSTSGDTERYVEIGGKRYSHIVDPKTGLGVVDRCTVTVIAPDGATADALDTAVYVLGPERGLPLVEPTQGASAYIVRQTAEGRRIYRSLDGPEPETSPRPTHRSRPMTGTTPVQARGASRLRDRWGTPGEITASK